MYQVLGECQRILYRPMQTPQQPSSCVPMNAIVKSPVNAAVTAVSRASAVNLLCYFELMATPRPMGCLRPTHITVRRFELVLCRCISGCKK